MSHQMLLFTMLGVAVMGILLVSRHTRRDEEGGRLEVLRSFPVGRLSNLSATIFQLFSINLLVALLVGVGLSIIGLEGMDIQGSFMYGLGLGLGGWFFGCVTALFAQLASSSRGTVGYSFVILGAAYMIRGIGDISNEVLSWISPLHWIISAEVYVNNYLWPMLMAAAVSLLILGLAFYLNSLRDLEAGFIPAKPGRKTASRFLQSPLGHSLRLQRTVLIGWLVALLLLGASYGSVLGDMEAYMEGNEMMQQVFLVDEGFRIEEQFITTLLAIIAMTTAIPALMMITKLRKEEQSNRLEGIFGRSVSRERLMGSYLFLAIFMGTVGLFLSSYSLVATGNAMIEDPVSLMTVLKATAIYLPPIFAMIGLAVLIVGVFPKITVGIWIYMTYSFFAVYFANNLLNVPELMVKLSFFGHIPAYPVEEITVFPLVVLTVIGILMTIIGFIGYRRRDLDFS